MTTSLPAAEHLSGYDTHDRYYASQFTQGNRRVYSLDLSLAAVAALLPRPDPDHPGPGNRKVDPDHAHDFADYVREKEDWVSPALILRAPNIFEFKQEAEAGGSHFGILSVPRVARTDLAILDGQHRILGVHMAVQDIATELEAARQLVAAAKRNGEDPNVVALHEGTVKKLMRQRERFGVDRIPVQIVLEEDERSYKQMFVDIAENAKGITKTLQARFDSRKVVNRVMVELIQKHPLLVGRVEDERDQVKHEGHLVSAKHVTEIIRAVVIGFGRRISRKQEEALAEKDILAKTTQFLATMDAFPAMADIQEGKLSPADLRRTSLLGSATMLRVLAGAYHELTEPRVRQKESTPPAISTTEVRDFFRSLSPFMGVPVTDPLWINTGVFEVGASAPRARGGDMLRLSENLARWARDGLPTETTPDQTTPDQTTDEASAV